MFNVHFNATKVIKAVQVSVNKGDQHGILHVN